MANVDITILNVDPNLLREQRDAVLGDIEHNLTLAGQDGTAEHLEALEGLVNMLDHMLDLAEGYKTGAEQTIHMVRWDHKHGEDHSFHRTFAGATAKANTTMCESLKNWIGEEKLAVAEKEGDLPGEFSELTGYNEFVNILSFTLNP